MIEDLKAQLEARVDAQEQEVKELQDKATEFEVLRKVRARGLFSLLSGMKKGYSGDLRSTRHLSVTEEKKKHFPRKIYTVMIHQQSLLIMWQTFLPNHPEIHRRAILG